MPEVKTLPTTVHGTTLNLPRHRHEWWTKNPNWEYERIESMIENINQGDSVWDIGSEEGDIISLIAKMVGDEGSVVLIEPSPFYAPTAKLTFEANSLKQPLVYYVGFASDTTDENPRHLDFDSTDNNGWPACAYDEIRTDKGFRHLYQETLSTPQIKLDDLAERHKIKPDVLNLDCEGSEYRILLGARNILTEHRPLVYVSVHEQFLIDMYGQTAQDLYNFMERLGYKRKHLATDHESHELFYPQGRVVI